MPMTKPAWSPALGLWSRVPSQTTSSAHAIQAMADGRRAALSDSPKAAMLAVAIQ